MAVNELIKYDSAMAEKFRVSKLDGTPVPMVFATPQRAFATLAELFDLTGDDREKRVPLPAMALHRSLPVVDLTRYRFTKRWKACYDSPPDHKKMKVMGPPQTVTIDYSLEVWAYTEPEFLSIVKQLSLKFMNEIAYIMADLEEYGKKRFSVRNGGLTDASILEPSEEERALRATQALTLNAVLHQPLRTVKTVLEIEQQYRDQNTDELLDIVEVTE